VSLRLLPSKLTYRAFFFLEKSGYWMDARKNLQSFAHDMTKGYRLIREKRDEEGLKKLQPFITLFLKMGTFDMRLFSSYCIAQFRTGDIEGFLQTYEYIQKNDVKTDEERKVKAKLDRLFHEIMEQL